jgi:hypothetical protein
MTAVSEGEATFVGGCGAGAVAQATHGAGTPLGVGQTVAFGDGLRGSSCPGSIMWARPRGSR